MLIAINAEAIKNTHRIIVFEDKNEDVFFEAVSLSI